MVVHTVKWEKESVEGMYALGEDVVAQGELENTL